MVKKIANIFRSSPRLQRLDSSFSHGSSYSDEIDATPDLNGKVGRRSHFLEPEYAKLVISYVYMFCVFTMTAFVMVCTTKSPMVVNVFKHGFLEKVPPIGIGCWSRHWNTARNWDKPWSCHFVQEMFTPNGLVMTIFYSGLNLTRFISVQTLENDLFWRNVLLLKKIQ